ncbi:unnamed protein product [Camellia sinensis]
MGHKPSLKKLEDQVNSIAQRSLDLAGFRYVSGISRYGREIQSHRYTGEYPTRPSYFPVRIGRYGTYRPIFRTLVEGDKSMLDLFLDGFWLGENTPGLRDHLLIVAVDQMAYERCMFLKLYCYKLETDGVDYDGKKLFMSGDFVKMMWRRTTFLGDVLKRDYNFIFT